MSYILSKSVLELFETKILIVNFSYLQSSYCMSEQKSQPKLNKLEIITIVLIQSHNILLYINH